MSYSQNVSNLLSRPVGGICQGPKTNSGKFRLESIHFSNVSGLDGANANICRLNRQFGCFLQLPIGKLYLHKFSMQSICDRSQSVGTEFKNNSCDSSSHATVRISQKTLTADKFKDWIQPQASQLQPDEDRT